MGLFTWKLKKLKSTNGASGDFGTASNWLSNGLPTLSTPGAGDDALINLPGGYTFRHDRNRGVRRRRRI
jgi:hypothetical protein